jgi:uncharacterized protein YfaS (alpha-2-macroglobulin family)
MWLMLGAAALAQPPTDTRPAFSLASGSAGNSRERPSVYLTFRRLDHLDFRIYRVNDPAAFMAGLKDLHQLGSEEPLVEQVPTLLERIAAWKAARRDETRTFLRRQFSRKYRAARRQRLDTQQVALRRTLRVNTFAQVPLLNPAQLVTSWRELLPRVRDPEFRRIPLELTEPGMYVVEAVHAPHRAYTIVLVSDIGVVSKAAPGQVLLYAANRFTGQPAGGCTVRLIGNRQTLSEGLTADDGTFSAALEEISAEEVVAVTRCGEATAATDPGGWYLRLDARSLVGYLYTDKPIYRPGHTAHLKGVLRWRRRGALHTFDGRQVEVRITDPTDKVVFRDSRPVDDFGSVSASWEVSRGAALGYYSVSILAGDAEASGAFEVQEYRRPEYEVRVTPASRFVVQGNPAGATVDARYYFGQPVAAGRVRYVVHRQPYYSPLRWSDEDENGEGGWWYAGDQIAEGEARLADDGTVRIEVPTAADDQLRDYSLRIEARVADAAGREVSGSGLVHATYGPFMLLATGDEYVKRPREQATLSIRALDYAGAPQPDRTVHVWLERRVPGRDWNESSETVTQGEVTTGADGRASWSLTMPAVPGDYRWRAGIEVGGGRMVQDTAYVWIPGPSSHEVDETGDRYLELIPDRRSYAPGDTARLLVRGDPFDQPVLITKEGQHVSWYRVAHARSSEAIDVPITEADIGDTWVNVVFLRDDRLFRAERRLRVPAASRQLQLVVTAASPVSRPREPASFDITATDAAGRPVRAQVSVGVVDEAVYGVKPDITPDSLRFFHRREYSQVGTQFSRTYAFVGYSGTEELTLARRRRPAHGLADFKGERTQPQVRKEFPDAIYWAPDVVTDAQGRARVTLTYPDALTTWRLTARAITPDTLVGSTIARTTTTKDLIVRVVTPRFLSQTDTVVVPVVTHNYLSGERDIAVALGADGLTPAGAESAEGSARSVLVPSGGDRRLDWTFTAPDVGRATLTARAAAGPVDDGVEVAIPVLPYGLKIEQGQSGSILGNGGQQVAMVIPPESNPAARTIEVSLAPSLAGSLLGALDFLTGYPYGCTEQVLSSFVPALVVTRTLGELGLPPTERLLLLDRHVTAGLQRVLALQHDDGGWGWWKTGENHPFMTAYAVEGLLEARARGYKVDEWRVRRGVSALAGLYAKYPRAVPALKAYVVLVLVKASDALKTDLESESYAASAALDELWRVREDLTAYGRALLLQALDMRKDGRGDTLARDLLDEATRKGDLAYWAVDHDPLLDDWADTSVEATAMAMRALVRRDPRQPVLEAGARYLMASRSGQYWSSTKQTAMVLYGLLDFMSARRETPEAFEVDVTVNGRSAGTTGFTPEDLTDPEPVRVSVPAASGTNHVSLTRRGGGALHWSVTARYYDTRAPIERTGSRRLALARRYYTLSPVTVKGRTVYRETPFAGTAAPGDVLLVRIAAAGSADWRYLMIEDPLPAGTEPIADDELYELEKRPSGVWWNGRREFRDDRAVFFRDRLQDGRTDLHYLLRVTTPGAFTALPARITPMYVPGASASSDIQRVTVESSAPEQGR